MKYLKRYNNLNESLLKEVENLAFDADFGFEIFNKWLDENDLKFDNDIPDIPALLSDDEKKDFISYYKKEKSIKQFNI